MCQLAGSMMTIIFSRFFPLLLSELCIPNFETIYSSTPIKKANNKTIAQIVRCFAFDKVIFQDKLLFFTFSKFDDRMISALIFLKRLGLGMWSVLVVQSEQHLIYDLMAGGGADIEETDRERLL